jgi:hypothetical protein
MRDPAVDPGLWQRVQELVYPRRTPSKYPPFARSEASVTRKRASWLYYTLLDDRSLRDQMRII